jgi:hypothetical protein
VLNSWHLKVVRSVQKRGRRWGDWVGVAPSVLGFSVIDWPGSRNLTGGDKRLQAPAAAPGSSPSPSTGTLLQRRTTAKLTQLKQVDNERPDLVLTTICGTPCCAPPSCFF